MKDKDIASKKKLIILSAKIILTASTLYLVFIQVNLEEIQKYIKKADFFYLFMALLALNVGQIISGLRMRYYFKTEELHLSKPFAISLYYVGMLFNLILPGGIGGDGYKAYYLKKNHQFSFKTSIRLIISSRGSGLLLLVVFTLVLALFSDYITSLPFAYTIIITCIIGVFPLYYILARKLLKESMLTQIGASRYSFFVQGLVIITAFMLLSSIGYTGDITDYLVLFMISSIVSVVPISVGGVGMRELTFFYGAGVLHLNPELGITISVLYFAVNTLASLLGVIFFYRLGKT